MESTDPQIIPNLYSSHFATRSRRLIITILLVLGGGLMLGAGGYEWYKTNQKPSVNSLNTLTQFHTASLSGVTRVKQVKVDVSGAVEKPGVYEIPYDSRVQDVLITAGGLQPKADQKYISKSINLAQQVKDGEKYYFPFLGEVPTNIIPTTGDVKSKNTPVLANQVINVNQATAEQLDTLPGVGPVTAQKIIVNRPYQNMSELVSKKAISQSVLNKIKDQISL